MSLMPSEPSAFNIFSWMKADFEKLPTFVGGAIDFGALATTTNFAKMLAQDGCKHVEGVKEGPWGPIRPRSDFSWREEIDL